MPGKRTADLPPHDRDYKKRRSSQSDGAAAAPPLQPDPSFQPTPPFEPDPSFQPDDPSFQLDPSFQPTPPFEPDPSFELDPSFQLDASFQPTPPFEPDPSFQPTPPLPPALPPIPGAGTAAAAAGRLPPIAFWRQRFRSQSGHYGLSVWKARWSNVRPPLSFQVYLTFDVSHWSSWQLWAFAETLWYQCTPALPATEEEMQQWQQQNQLPQLLAHEPHSLPIRLDIVMLGAVSEHTRNLTCMQHYRMRRDVNSQIMDANDGTQFYWPPAPSCRGPDGVQYGGFLIQVRHADYLATNMRLRLLFFDAEDANDQSQAETATRSIWRPADQYGDDTLVVSPTWPGQSGGNLWAWNLGRVWETMSMVKEWRNAYYGMLA